MGLPSHTQPHLRNVSVERGEGRERRGRPGFVDGAFEFLLQLPHVTDAGVVIGCRLLVLSFAARPRLLRLHHLEQ